MSLVQRLQKPDNDLWLRPTVFAIEGNWGTDTVSDLVITCYQQPKKRPDPMKVGIEHLAAPAGQRLPRAHQERDYQVGRLAASRGGARLRRHRPP